MTIHLYLGFIIGLISNFEKLVQRDLNKKIMHKFVKNVFQTSSNKRPGRFQRNLGYMLL